MEDERKECSRLHQGSAQKRTSERRLEETGQIGITKTESQRRDEKGIGEQHAGSRADSLRG